MTDQATIIALEQANHAIDDAYWLTWYNNAVTTITAGSTPPTPPIDYENGGGSSKLCDCVLETFTTEATVVITSPTEVTITDVSTPSANDSYTIAQLVPQFTAKRFIPLGGSETYDFTGLPANTYYVYLVIETNQGAVIGVGVKIDWDGTTVTAVNSNPLDWDYEVCVGCAVNKYEDGVLIGAFDPVTDAPYTPVGTLKCKCGNKPKYDFSMDWENLIPTADTKLDLIEGASERITVGATVQLLTVPVGAVGSIIQVQRVSGSDPLRWYANGSVPTGLIGRKSDDYFQILLGCNPEDHNGIAQELANFQAIANGTDTFILEVDYYKEV